MPELETTTAATEVTAQTTQQTYTPEQTQAYIKQLRDEAKAVRLEADSWKSKFGEKEKEFNTLSSTIQIKDSELNTLNLKYELKGQVVDADKALKLVDKDKHFKDNKFSVELFLADNPFFKTDKSVEVNNPKDDVATTVVTEDLSNKSQDWLADNWAKVVNKKK